MTVVRGGSGPAVLLLPGGAEAVDGFFPGLAEGLLADPGCRVIEHDRPGVEGSDRDGTLADATADLHRTISEVGAGPVVAIGQSLGGVVALQLAVDHPDDVAGLVLLDPTPVNDVALVEQVVTRARQAGRFSRAPGGAALLRGLLRLSVRRSVRRHSMGPAEAAAMRRTANLDLARLARAVVGLDRLAEAFDANRLPEVPAAVVTADRKPGDPIRAAHQRLADALGAPLTSWPAAEHSVHLTHPAEVLQTCRDVVRSV